MDRKNIVIVVGLVLTVLVAALYIFSSGRAVQPTDEVEYRLDNLPKPAEFITLPIETQQKIYTFILSTPYDKAVEYIEQAFRKNAKGQAFKFSNLDVQQDPLLIDQKWKSPNNFFVTVEFLAPFDQLVDSKDMEALMEQWYQDAVSTVMNNDLAVSVRIKEIKVRFKDLESSNSRDFIVGVESRYSSEDKRPQIPNQSEEEKQTITLICDYFDGLAAKDQGEFFLKRFGISDVGTNAKDELYIEATIAWSDEKISVQEISDNLVQDLKSNGVAQNYIKANKLASITVVLNTPGSTQKYETFHYTIDK